MRRSIGRRRRAKRGANGLEMGLRSRSCKDISNCDRRLSVVMQSSSIPMMPLRACWSNHACLCLACRESCAKGVCGTLSIAALRRHCWSRCVAVGLLSRRPLACPLLSLVWRISATLPPAQHRSSSASSSPPPSRRTIATRVASSPFWRRAFGRGSERTELPESAAASACADPDARSFARSGAVVADAGTAAATALPDAPLSLSSLPLTLAFALRRALAAASVAASPRSTVAHIVALLVFVSRNHAPAQRS